MLDGEATVIPDRDRPWQRVELGPGAAAILTRAREASTTQIVAGVYVEARLEPGGEHTRVLIDGIEVGTVPGVVSAVTVVGKLERTRPGEPYFLEVQLP